MNHKFLQDRIRSISDDDLRRLLHLEITENSEIVSLAREEAERRSLPYENIDLPIKECGTSSAAVDLSALRVWNWAAFLLTPFWTLAHKLDRWTVVWFVPGINIAAAVYLGFNGNKIAYKKNKVIPVDVFLAIQKEWNFWAIRIFLVGGLIWLATKITSGI